jgi:DNA-binding GntR family transcriptional regulator
LAARPRQGRRSTPNGGGGSAPAEPQDAEPGEASRSSSQTDAALKVIRSRIIDMTLEPGSRIDERILVDRFRLGRTPAREAISRLVAEGFVKIIPQRGGTYVRKLDLEEMGEIVVAHQLAESVLGQLCKMDDITLLPDLKAIQRRYVEHVRKREFLMITEVNQEFHLRMYRAIGNSLFYEFAESTHRHVQRLNVYIYHAEASSDPDYQSAQFAANLDQHNQIIEAVGRADRALLTELLPEHARHTQYRLVHLMQNKAVGSLHIDTSKLGF